MERLLELTDIEIRMGFAASCVEVVAKRAGCSYSEMYQRMKRVGLINNYIMRHYDTIHTESRENITDSILECLENWEPIKVLPLPKVQTSIYCDKKRKEIMKMILS